MSKLGGTERVGSKGYFVKPTFNTYCGNKISEKDLADTGKSAMCWAILTYVNNPFNPERQILFLTGCSRFGQYLLLNALHDPKLVDAIRQIHDFRQQNDGKGTFFQMAIKGQSEGKKRRGEIARNHPFEIVPDLSDGKMRPFFTDQSRHPYQKFNPGDSISDLSLLALVPRQLPAIETILETLGENVDTGLRKAVERHINKSNASPINLHVTLFELLHTIGQHDSDFISSITREDTKYIKRLKADLATAPPFMMRLRQTMITPYSLQVLADIYFDHDNFQLPSVWEGIWAEHTLSSMDMIIEACREAEVELGEMSSKFNVNKAPNPLHLTILRKTQDITERDWVEAQKWAASYNRRIWGKIDNVSLVLAHARIAPFELVRYIEVSSIGAQ